MACHVGHGGRCLVCGIRKTATPEARFLAIPPQQSFVDRLGNLRPSLCLGHVAAVSGGNEYSRRKKKLDHRGAVTTADNARAAVGIAERVRGGASGVATSECREVCEKVEQKITNRQSI
jgi:hypothetical protein